MTIRAIWSFLACMVLLMIPESAHSQIVYVLINPFDNQVPGQRISRFQLGGYWTQWNLSSFRELGATVDRDANPSLLVSADYFATPHLAVGAWRNYFSGSDNQTGRPDLPRKIDDFDADYWDLHATYYLPGERARGWSFQVGYGAVHSEVRQVAAIGGGTIAGTARSANLWIAKTHQIGGWNPDRHRPCFLYASLGYHPSKEFNHATNLIVGASFSLSQSVKLTGSVWLNDFDDLAVRTTVGLTGSL
jgi:hypothetical protein